MDLLSELLNEVRVEASALAAMHLRSPFHLQVRYAMPYSLTVLHGQCEWRDETDTVHVLQQGDSVLVLREAACGIASGPGIAAQPFGDAWHGNRLPNFTGSRDLLPPLKLTWGGDGPACELLGIAFSFEALHHAPMLTMLPATLVVPRPAHGQDAGVDAAVAFLAAEGEEGRAGYAALAAHHAETVFLGLLRSHALAGRLSTVGLLAGLRDRHLSAALTALHAAPGERWTVARLAGAAALSRSVFAARFTASMGITPMQYVTVVRMRWSARCLASDKVAIAALSEQAGYGSERAFRATFERHFGMSPGAWRKTARGRA